MPWQNDMVLILRGLVNDMTAPYTYSNSRMEELLVISAQLLKKDIDLSAYTISVDGVSISPDPVDNDAHGVVNLTCLKAACLILGAEVKLNAARAVSVEDASASIDFRGTFEATKSIYDQYCKDLAKAIVDYKTGELSNIRAVITPTTVESNPTGIIFG